MFWRAICQIDNECHKESHGVISCSYWCLVEPLLANKFNACVATDYDTNKIDRNGAQSNKPDKMDPIA